MSDEFRRVVDEAESAIHGSQANGRAPIRDDDDAVARLSALLSVEPRDLDAEPVTPMDPLPGFPFLTPRAVAHLSGPTGRGKSQVVAELLPRARPGRRPRALSGLRARRGGVACPGEADPAGAGA
jgi:hypothetical protein